MKMSGLSCYILTFLSLMLYSTSYAWREPSPYGGFGGGPQFSLPHIHTPEQYTDDIPLFYFPNCMCMKLKLCPYIYDIIKEGRSSIVGRTLEELRKTHCGFDGKEPLVCCPPHIPPKDAGPGPLPFNNGRKFFIPRDGYLASLLPNNILFTSTQRPIKFPGETRNPFKDYRDIGIEHNLVDFEDPETSKNCPPSFYDEFDIPANHEIKRVKPTKKPPHRFNPKQQTHPTFNNRLPQRPITQYSPFSNRGNAKQSKKRLLNTEHCGISVNTRIVGGKDAGPGQFPWMARLAYRNVSSGRLTYRCAGSIISDKYVVTAAHCVTNLVDSLEVYLVRVGELDVMRSLDCSVDPVRCAVPQDYDIDKIIPHPNYDTPKYANDIALIRLVRPFNASNTIPICMPLGPFSIADRNLTGQTGIVAGWGARTPGTLYVQLSLTARPNPTLQWVRLPFVDQPKCAGSYARFSANSRTPIIISPSQLCAQGMERKDACQGDSGGPLMSEGTETNLRYTLLGLVSFGPRSCGISNFPGVYTRISAYMDWIIDSMEL